MSDQFLFYSSCFHHKFSEQKIHFGSCQNSMHLNSSWGFHVVLYLLGLEVLCELKFLTVNSQLCRHNSRVWLWTYDSDKKWKMMQNRLRLVMWNVKNLLLQIKSQFWRFFLPWSPPLQSEITACFHHYYSLLIDFVTSNFSIDEKKLIDSNCVM